MKSKFSLALICLFSLLPIAADAQWGLQNGDLESWRRKEFRCCGRNVDLPSCWGIPEQSCGLNLNKFVQMDEDSHNVHSGRCSALLLSDTSYFNDIGLQPGMLVYGGYQDQLDSAIRIGQPITQYGYPIDSTPTGIDFWLKMSHDMPDTFSYIYVVTHWDTASHSTDTLAVAAIDIADTQSPMDEWFHVSHRMQYRHQGYADSVRIIFFGGRFGNPALRNNATWIDDIALSYGAGPAILDIAEPDQLAFAISPNPASDKLRIQRRGEATGTVMEIYDALGRLADKVMLEAPLQALDISALATGSYICRILDDHGQRLYYSRISIVR